MECSAVGRWSFLDLRMPAEAVWPPVGEAVEEISALGGTDYVTFPISSIVESDRGWLPHCFYSYHYWLSICFTVQAVCSVGRRVMSTLFALDYHGPAWSLCSRITQWSETSGCHPEQPRPMGQRKLIKGTGSFDFVSLCAPSLMCQVLSQKIWSCG